jgi:hypothetical protein
MRWFLCEKEVFETIFTEFFDLRNGNEISSVLLSNLIRTPSPPQWLLFLVGVGMTRRDPNHDAMPLQLRQSDSDLWFAGDRGNMNTTEVARPSFSVFCPGLHNKQLPGPP